MAENNLQTNESDMVHVPLGPLNSQEEFDKSQQWI